METQSRWIFNRPDCPYGCGAPLDSKLRWQATPCHRCGRPLYPAIEVTDLEGRSIWPPASVPRPPEAGEPDVGVYYVITEEEAQAREAIGKPIWEAHRAASKNRACMQTLSCLAAVLFVMLVVVALAFYFLVVAPR
jgi:hypothetical protein